MKKIFLNTKQIDYLNEANIVATAADNSLSSFAKTATDTNTTSDIQKAKVAGDVNLVISGPKSNDNQPTQAVNVAAGQTVSDAIGDQANDDLIRNGGKVAITGDGLGESHVFTKKTLEEVRLRNLRRNGVIMSKRDLTEKILKK
jgi:hypothetical protein